MHPGHESQLNRTQLIGSISCRFKRNAILKNSIVRNLTANEGQKQDYVDDFGHFSVGTVTRLVTGAPNE